MTPDPFQDPNAMNAAPSAPPARELSAHELAFLGREATLHAPASDAELGDLIRTAEQEGRTLVPAGLGAHAYLGNPPPSGAWIVSLHRLNRVLRYEPGDFTVGCQAGVPLAELRAILEASGQEVGVDLPIEARGTVGGLVARAPSGARRARHGAVRSQIIGVHALRGGGRRYKSGGMVVKNVAGYEVLKLLAGTLGTTGPLLEINFKLRPLPLKRRWCAAALDTPLSAAKTATALREARLDPAAVWILSGPEGIPAIEDLGKKGATHLVLALLEGSPARVDWQATRVEELLAAEAPLAVSHLQGPEVARALDHLARFEEPGEPLPGGLGIARLGTLPTRLSMLEEALRNAAGRTGCAISMAADALCGVLLVRWTETARRGGSPGEPFRDFLQALRTEAQRGELSGSCLHVPPDLRRETPYLLAPAKNAALSRKLLRTLDPRQIFCPDRVLGPESPKAAP